MGCKDGDSHRDLARIHKLQTEENHLKAVYTLGVHDQHLQSTQQKTDDSYLENKQIQVKIQKYNEVLTKMKQELNDALTKMRQEIKEIQTEIGQEVKEVQIEIGEEVKEVQTEIKQEVKEVQTEIGQEVKEVQTEIRQEVKEVQTKVKEVQTENSKLKTKEKLTETCIGYVHNRGVQTTETKEQTKEAETQTDIRYLVHVPQQTDETSMNTDGKHNRGIATVNTQQIQEVDLENNHTPIRCGEEVEGSEAYNTNAEVTRRYQQAELEQSDTEDSQSPQGIPQGRPQLSPTQTAHQTSQELQAHSLPPTSPQSSVPYTEAFHYQPELENASVTNTPSSLLKSVVSSQVNRVGVIVHSTRAQSSHGLVPQQPGCSERPHNTGPASPQLWEDPPQSPMVSDVRVLPARVRAHCPPGQLQQFRNSHPQSTNPCLPAVHPLADNSAGMSSQCSISSAKRHANNPPFQQNKRLCIEGTQQMPHAVNIVGTDGLTDFSTQAEYRWQQISPQPVHTISTAVAAATVSTSNSTVINSTSPNGSEINNTINNSPQLQMSSSLGARLSQLQTRVSRMETLTRLSQLENRVLQMERECGQEPVGHSEIRMVNMQHQLGDIMQRLDDIYRQLGDSDSVIMSIANFSDRVSSPSTFISLGSE